MERPMFKILKKAPHEDEPKYYICARRDNGFIAAYRAYFFIKGSKIRRVSVFRYEHSVIFGKRADDYRERYDTDALITLLKKAEITLKGYIELILHEFDGYQLIHMVRTDQEGHGMILGEQSLFFRDGNPIKIGSKINLGSVRDFFRYRKRT